MSLMVRLLTIGASSSTVVPMRPHTMMMRLETTLRMKRSRSEYCRFSHRMSCGSGAFVTWKLPPICDAIHWLAATPSRPCSLELCFIACATLAA